MNMYYVVFNKKTGKYVESSTTYVDEVDAFRFKSIADMLKNLENHQDIEDLRWRRIG